MNVQNYRGYCKKWNSPLPCSRVLYSSWSGRHCKDAGKSAVYRAVGGPYTKAGSPTPDSDILPRWQVPSEDCRWTASSSSRYQHSPRHLRSKPNIRSVMVLFQNLICWVVGSGSIVFLKFRHGCVPSSVSSMPCRVILCFNDNQVTLFGLIAWPTVISIECWSCS